MNIEYVMRKDVASCEPDRSFADVAELMIDNDCGCVAVVAGAPPRNRLVGTITDRGMCLEAYRRNEPFDRIPAAAAMSTAICTCSPDDDSDEVAHLMSRHRLDRLVVVDEDDRLLGVVSLAELARRAQRHGAWERSAMDAAAREAVPRTTGTTPHAS